MKNPKNTIVKASLCMFFLLWSSQIECTIVNLTRHSRQSLLLQSASDLEQDTPSTQTLLNNHDFAYIGPVSVGTPAQSFYVIYDTGSDALFVQTTQCKTCTSSKITGFPQYTPNSFNTYTSSTYVGNGYTGLSYGSLTAIGVSGTETVTLSEIKVNTFPMVFVTQEGSSQFQTQSIAYDGIMGLSNNQYPQNIFEVAYNQGEIAQFSFDLTNMNFYYGDIPEKFTSAPHVSTSLSSRWALQLIGLEIGGSDQISNVSYTDAVIDSGTSLIYIDQSVIDEVLSQGGQSDQNPYTYPSNYIRNCYACNCPDKIALLPDIVFYFQGAKVTLTPNDYIVNDGSNYGCLIGLLPNSQLGMLLLGDAYMRSLVVTYDKNDSSMYLYGPNSLPMINLDTLPSSITFIVMGSLIILSVARLMWLTTDLVKNSRNN